MKFAAIVAISCFIATANAYTAPKGSSKVNDAEHIAALNAESSTWTAGHNENFGERTYDDVRAWVAGTQLGHHIVSTITHGSSVGTHKGSQYPNRHLCSSLSLACEFSLQPRYLQCFFQSDHLDETLPQAYYDSLNATIPSEFDSRKEFAGLILPIRNQEQCGSCWAFSAAEVLSDRFAIQTKNKASPVLSPEDLVSCDSGDNGCGGGMLPNAWRYLSNTGIVTDKCFPYGAGKGNAPACASKCQDGEKWQKYKAGKTYAM